MLLSYIVVFLAMAAFQNACLPILHGDLAFSTGHSIAATTVHALHILWPLPASCYLHAIFASMSYFILDADIIRQGNGGLKMYADLAHHVVAGLGCLIVLVSVLFNGISNTHIYSLCFLCEASVPALNYMIYLKREDLHNPKWIAVVAYTFYVITRPVLLSYCLCLMRGEFGVGSLHFIVLSIIVALNTYWSVLLGLRVANLPNRLAE